MGNLFENSSYKGKTPSIELLIIFITEWKDFEIHLK